MLLLGAILLALFVVPAPWGLVLVSIAAVVEIAETFFWIRFSQRRRIQAGAETLVGARAEVVTALAPVGQVRIAGELWQARSEGRAEPGAPVRVVGRDGLTLFVEPE